MLPDAIVEGIQTRLNAHPRVTAQLQKADSNHQENLKSTGKLINALFELQPQLDVQKNVDLFYSQLNDILDALSAENDEQLLKLLPAKVHAPYNITISLMCAQAMHIAWMICIDDPSHKPVDIYPCLTAYQAHQAKALPKETWMVWQYRLLAILKQQTLTLMLAIYHSDMPTFLNLLKQPFLDLSQRARNITPREFALTNQRTRYVQLMDDFATHIAPQYIVNEIIALTRTFPEAARQLQIDESTPSRLLLLITDLISENLLHTARLQKKWIRDDINQPPDHTLQHTQIHLHNFLILLKTNKQDDAKPETELENLMLLLYKILKNIEQNPNAFFKHTSTHPMTLPLLVTQTMAMAQTVSDFSLDTPGALRTFTILYQRSAEVQLSDDLWMHWERKLCVVMGYLDAQSSYKDNGEPDTPPKTTPLWNYVNQTNIPAAEKAITDGADLDITDQDDCTLLHLAVFRHNIDMIKMLLKYPKIIKLIDARNKWLESPLHFAVSRLTSNDAIATLLIQHGADVKAINTAGYSLLYLANEKNNPRLVALLLKQGSIPSKADITRSDFSSGWTFLQQAVHQGNLGLTTAILAKAKDHSVDILNMLSNNPDRCTALHAAVVGGHREIVETLLQQPQIDRNIKDANGLTPYDLAIHLNKHAIIDLLRPAPESMPPESPKPSPRTTRS